MESLPFVSFSDGKFTVEATKAEEAGIYTAFISIQVDGYLLDSMWTLEVKDLCLNTVLQADANLKDLQVDVGGSSVSPLAL